MFFLPKSAFHATRLIFNNKKYLKRNFNSSLMSKNHETSKKPTKMESQQMSMKGEALSQANPLRVLFNNGEILRTKREL